MDKCFLNWPEYEANMMENLRKLRDDQKMSDVTLVTDDGQHIHAHKIILSVRSNLFSEMFMNMKSSYSSDMLIYLTGISSGTLEPVIDFIYKGEALITEEDMKVFIETGKDLQVKGLEGELTKAGEIVTERSMSSEEIGQRHDNYDNDDEDYNIQMGASNNDVTVSEIDETDLKIRTTNEISPKISEMIEKMGVLWRCKFCGKAAITKGNIQDHAEIHIEGTSHSCHICSKTFSKRNGLKVHISNVHTGRFYCTICGESGMNKQAFMKHKNVHK